MQPNREGVPQTLYRWADLGFIVVWVEVIALSRRKYSYRNGGSDEDITLFRMKLKLTGGTSIDRGE